MHITVGLYSESFTDPTGSRVHCVHFTRVPLCLREPLTGHTAPYILSVFVFTFVKALRVSSALQAGRHVGLNLPASPGGGCGNRGLFVPRIQAFQTRGARPGARVPSHSLLGPKGMRLQGPAGGSAQTPGGTGAGPGRRDRQGRRPSVRLRPAAARPSAR